MSEIITYDDAKLGMELPSICRKVTHESINGYAEATGNFHPLHVDFEFAQKTPFGSTIAHSSIPVAFVSTLLNRHFGKAWNFGGRLRVFYKSSCRPGDTITTKAKIIKKSKIDARDAIELSIICENQKKETIIKAEALILY